MKHATTLVRFVAKLVLASAIVLEAFSCHARPKVEPVDSTKHPFRDAAGNILYMVLLNEEVARREPTTGEPPPVSTLDSAGRGNFRSWHRANVRHLVRRMEVAYHVTATNMTSWAFPSFGAYFSKAGVTGLARDPRVTLAFPQYQEDAKFAVTYSDRYDGNELVSWGKQAIGTDDAITTSNFVYIIDGGPNPHIDLSQLVFPANPVNEGYSGAPGHGDHVAGILAADRNDAIVRGVNPGATVISVNRGDRPEDIAAAFDWVLADSEQRGIFAVANFSSNSPVFASGGELAYVLRRISNRVLIVQAAGNHAVNACTVAYGRANPDDGILVVGGTNESGDWSGPYDNSAAGYELSEGSNTNEGGCIEVWAPSQRITSAWNEPPTGTSSGKMVLSGTSMAAPHVSALAARYGSTSTRPVEREHFISALKQFTGFYDPAGAPIYVASYTAGTPVPARRLPATNVYASSTMSGTSPANVNDGIYLTGIWSATGSAPGWIELDLGASHFISSIRMTPDMSPAGTVTHTIFVGNSPSPSGVGGEYTGHAATLEPISVNISASARFIRVYTSSSPSWVAWREIEIYGF